MCLDLRIQLRMSSSVNENHEDTQFHFGFGISWFKLLAKVLTVHLVAFVVFL